MAVAFAMLPTSLRTVVSVVTLRKGRRLSIASSGYTYEVSSLLLFYARRRSKGGVGEKRGTVFRRAPINVVPFLTIVLLLLSRGCSKHEIWS